jgi:hypothetical protein
MKLEKSTPNAEGKDIIQYRCNLCNRTERVQLFRRSRESGGLKAMRIQRLALQGTNTIR